MELPLLRLLIQEKLADGRLPSTPISRVSDDPGTGQRCDGCGETATHAQTVFDHLDTAGRRVQFHVACFHVWNVERQVPGPTPSTRLPARSAFRSPGARLIRPWAPSAPSARPATP